MSTVSPPNGGVTFEKPDLSQLSRKDFDQINIRIASE